MAKSFVVMQEVIGSIVTSPDGAREGVRAARDTLVPRNETLKHEIVEREEAEHVLQASEAQFRGLVEDAPIAILLYSPTLELQFCNQAAATLFGLRPEEIGGVKPWTGPWERVLEDGTRLGPGEGPIAQAAASGKPVRDFVLGLITTTSTQPTWVEVAAVPQFDSTGRMSSIITVCNDITARRASQAANALYAELLRHLPIGFTAWHPDDVNDPHSLRLIAANAATSRYAGRPLDAMIGRTIDDCYPGAMDRATDHTYLRVLRTQQPVNLGDFPYDGPSGLPSFFSVRLFPLPNNAVGVLSEDITDRKRAADAAEHLSALVESSSDAIIGKTLDGIITSWNHGAERIYGYTAAEIVGQPIALLVPPDHPDELPSILGRIRTGERITQFATSRIRKDGVEIFVSISISPIKDEHGRIVGASIVDRDVMAQKTADDRILRQVQQLSALRSIDVSITSSYDIRLSLTVVLEQVTACLGVDAADVLLLDPATQTLTHAANRGFSGKEITKTRIRLGEGLPGGVALDRKRLGMPVLPVNRFVRVKLLQEESFVSYFAAPLMNKGQVLGVLELFTRTRIDPDEEWYEFFDAIADQAAIAIGDAAMFDDLRRRNVDLRLAYDATLEGWSRALDLRDHETEGHSRRVTEMTLQLARQLALREDELIQVRRGALLHDIGKLGVPDAILLKPGPLTEEEWVIMRKHPTYSYDLLSPIAYLRPALDVPYCHHEKWDGSGYPRSLRNTQIPLAARIFAVVDVWDALSSDRPYRSGWPESRVREHIAAGAGSHFDPEVVAAFLAMDWPARVNASGDV